jgi:hypothetical protein
MAIGLGMTPDEWQELRNQVDDSFWVMRAIGVFLTQWYHTRSQLDHRLSAAAGRQRWLFLWST